MLECEHFRCGETDTLENVQEGESDLIFVDAPRWSDMATGYFCSEHLTTCDDCGEVRHRQDVASTGHNHEVCQSCMEDYFSCEHCGDVHHQDHGNYSDETGGVYCEDCYNELTPAPKNTDSCRTCGGRNHNFDLLTERFICDCEAAKLEIGLVMRHDTMMEVLYNV